MPLIPGKASATSPWRSAALARGRTIFVGCFQKGICITPRRFRRARSGRGGQPLFARRTQRAVAVRTDRGRPLTVFSAGQRVGLHRSQLFSAHRGRTGTGPPLRGRRPMPRSHHTSSGCCGRPARRRAGSALGPRLPGALARRQSRQTVSPAFTVSGIDPLRVSARRLAALDRQPLAVRRRARAQGSPAPGDSPPQSPPEEQPHLLRGERDRGTDLLETPAVAR